MPSYWAMLVATGTSKEESHTTVARNTSTSDGVGRPVWFGKIKLPLTRSVPRLSALDRHASDIRTTFGIPDPRASSMLSRRLTASFGLAGALDNIQYSE